MKTFAAGFLLLSSLTFAQTADTPLTGKWKVHSSVAGNDSDQECTFTQTGKDFAGTCTADPKPVKATGKVDGDKVSWSYESDYNGTPLTLKYVGTLAGDKITGNASVDPFGVDGDFTATKTK